MNNNFKDTTSTEPEKIDKQIKIEDTFKMPQSDENVKETETKLAGTREAKKQSTEILQNASVSINATTGSQEVKAIELPDVFKKPFTKFVEPSETANGPKSEILRKCEARLDRLYRKLKAKEARLESQNAQKESTEIIQTASVTTDASSTGSQETKAIETRMEQHIELPDVLKGPFTKSGEPSSTETANSQDWRTADLSKQPVSLIVQKTCKKL